jgi:hypothetical protein
MKNITLTAAQLTKAQMGKEVEINTGETLTAIQLNDGWKYILAFGGQVCLVRYADNGLEAAVWALNASEEDYAEI